MEAVLAQVGRQGKNPITIPAMVFRVLLNLENDKNWKARVEAGFNALRACTFRVDSFEMPRIRGAGAFLGEWWYKGAGPGAHGEGAYLLNVQPGFIGCLSAFESGKRKLSSDRQQTIYDFMKKLSWQERKTLRFNKTDAGTPFYNAAAGLPPEQQSLLAFIEREITLRRDPIRKGHNATRVRPNAPGAGEARLYGHDFCPLIPTGKCYQGALGHFRNWPETGRTLFGTPLGAGIARGSHQGGLLSELGFQVPTGRSYSTRSSIVRTALAAFKVVVVDYLEGLVAARSADGEWLTLDDASKLHNEALRRKKWFLFLPENWRELRKRKWEARMGERAARGETPFAWRVTENPEEAECAHQTLSARAWSAGEPECGQVELPLHVRLRATRIDRRLSQGDVGRLLGVSQKTISQWERGAKPDDEGIVRGDSIPPRMLHLVRRWVETGESPTAEALADPRP
jgi:DNA-binding XRE family transcriptional regulator